MLTPDDQDRFRPSAVTIVTRLSDGGDLVAPEQPLILDHPAVSRRHACFRQTADGLVLEDLQSTNGSFVNRSRVYRPTRLAANDLVEIGPFRMLYDGRDLIRISRSRHAALNCDHLVCEVTNPQTRKRERILNDVSLTLRPGRVACVVGSSGSGKSTLLGFLSGRRRPTSGRVALGSLGLQEHFEVLKQDIAFLPQSEIVHEQLTLRQALNYAALLRLPRALPAESRKTAVLEAAEAVGLTHRLDTQIRLLSGGQRKRACLASEIIAKPGLLFLDEVTSGLDESTDREIMALLKQLSREGMSIVCVTHTLANLGDYCDDLVVMAPGGVLAWCGPPAAALRFFEVGALGEIFLEIDGRGVEASRDRFEAARAADGVAPVPLAASAAVGSGAGAGVGAAAGAAAGAVAGTAAGAEAGVAAGTGDKPAAPRLARGRESVHQLKVLLRRNVRLVLADKRAIALAATQSLTVGLLLGYAFMDLGAPALVPRSEAALLLLLGITALWMGCNSAGKEIVGELAIYRRERDMNVPTGAFVVSKFVVIGLFSVLQALVLIGACALLAERIPGGLGPQSIVMALAAICGTGLGLLISSWCNTRDQASVIVPLALAPQLILGGGIVPALPKPAEAFAETVISAHWIRQAAGGFRDLAADISPGAATALASQGVSLSLSVLVAHGLILLVLAWLTTHWRNAGRQ